MIKAVDLSNWNHTPIEATRIAATIAARNGWPATWVAALLAESGMNPTAYNPDGPAYGIFQLTPPGNSNGRIYKKTDIRGLPVSAQLVLAEKYFQKSGRKFTTAGDFRRSLAGGALAGLPEGVWRQEPSKGYTNNKGLDINKDGVITLAEVGQAADDIASKLRIIEVEPLEPPTEPFKETGSGSGVAMAAVLGTLIVAAKMIG